MKLVHRYKQRHLIILSLILFTAIGLIGIFFYFSERSINLDLNAISAANRTINAYFSALITVMALIITLTSNLYSPHLARMFVTHPLTLMSIFYVLTTNLFITITNLIPEHNSVYNIFTFIAFTLTNFATLGIIPTLYAISNFIRPSYFIKLIGKNACEHLIALNNIKNISNNKKNMQAKKHIKGLFNHIDILANMSSTAIQRKDKSVLKLIISQQFKVLKELINSNQEENNIWRNDNYIFTNGISEEGKYYLKSNDSWPEAYLLAKILEESKSLNNTENELQALLCREMTNSIDLCISTENYIVTRLILSIENAMIKDAIESKNSYKFSSLSYYYRINIELLIEQKDLLDEVLDSFIHYGEKCIEMNNHRFTKYFIFDLGRILHYLAFEDEDKALNYYKLRFRNIYKKFLASSNKTNVEMAQISIAKTFWILYSQNYIYLTIAIKNDFLKDNMYHAQILKNLFASKNPIDREYTDTFINVEFLSGIALNLAKDFMNDFPELVDQQEEFHKNVS